MSSPPCCDVTILGRYHPLSVFQKGQNVIVESVNLSEIHDIFHFLVVYYWLEYIELKNTSSWSLTIGKSEAEKRERMEVSDFQVN